MARLLCAWEFGGDLGHIRRLAALARALQRAGHEPILALCNLAHAAPLLAPFVWHQVPLLALAPHPNPAPLSATDVLAQLGFADCDTLAAALRAWRELIALTKPDAIVGDYAPTALLAARIAGLKRVGIGSGFSSPPRAQPMPALRAWETADEKRLREIDAGVLAAVNGALASLGANPLEHAGQLFESDLDLLCTFAEIDPFGPRDGADYLGPLDESASGLPVAWKRADGPRIFAYLKPGYTHFRAALNALASMPGEAIVAAPGLRAADAQALSSARVHVIAQAVDLSALLADCDVCVGHGGAGLTGRALAAGIPQGLLATHLEQLLIARRAADQGVAAIVSPSEPTPDLVAWMRDLVEHRGRLEAAKRIGASLASYSPRAAATLAAARIASMVGR